MGSCQAQFTQTVQISPTDSSTIFSYYPDHYCQSDPMPSLLSLAIRWAALLREAASFSATTDHGQLDLSAMQPGGPYVVFYDIDNRCAIDVRDSVWIDVPDDAAFGYPQASYCAGGVNPLPSSVAMPGGVFSEITGSVVFAM